MAAKLADARACGVSSGAIIGLMPAFQTCMSGRGWVLDHYGPDPATPRPRGNRVVRRDGSEANKGGRAKGRPNHFQR